MLSDPAWIGWANTRQGFVPHKLHAEMTGFPCDVLQKNELHFRAFIRKDSSYAFIILSNVMIKIFMLVREMKIIAIFYFISE